ncbi:MAG: fdxN element excision recombinase XisF [Scytonema sp. PMC 1070.18]|nr:fdxN element excision recombinase XisF [Scytonema sp. PMC 1070.18]
MSIYGYARVSSTEQAEEYDALNQQIARLKGAGAEVVLVDIESGRSHTRKEFTKLLKLVERGEVREVVVTRVDRLGRSDIDVIRTIQLFNDCGVILRILDAPIDISSSFGRFSASQMAALADFESRLLSERTKHGMAYFRSQGKVQTAPFGYQLNNEHKLEPHSHNFAIAREIIDLLLSGHSYGRVSKHLAEKYGIKFSLSGLRHWVKNPAITGHTRYFTEMEYRRNPKNPRKPVILRNTHPAIASEAEIAEILHAAKNKPRLSVRRHGDYPLKGLLRCHHCGGGMFRTVYKFKSGDEQSEWIRCARHAQGSQFCANKKNVRLEHLTEQVIDAITLKSQEIVQEVNVRDSDVVDSPALIELRAQLHGLQALQSTNPAILGAILDIRNQIEAEESRLRVGVKIAQDRYKLAWAYSQPGFWKELSQEDLRQVFRSFVLEVAVDSNGEVAEVTWDL